MTAHDRTPAPPLDEADLQAMEARAVAISPGPELSWQRECFGECQDVLALVAALRAAWRENARYRAALEEIALGLSALNLAREPGGVRFADRLDVLETRARAALAAPDTTSAAIPQSEDGRRQRFLRSLEAVGADPALIDRVRAALAAPGAGGQATEERT